jgi:hypothetical protein
MSLFDTHEAGLDILGGVGIGDFVPWLGVVGKLAGGLAGGSDGGSSPEAQKAAVQKAIEAQKQKEALVKAQADAARNKALLYGTVGVLGAGLLTFTVMKLAGKKR